MVSLDRVQLMTSSFPTSSSLEQEASAALQEPLKLGSLSPFLCLSFPCLSSYCTYSILATWRTILSSICPSFSPPISELNTANMTSPSAGMQTTRANQNGGGVAVYKSNCIATASDWKPPYASSAARSVHPISQV